jgi:hypothetical protein
MGAAGGRGPDLRAGPQHPRHVVAVREGEVDREGVAAYVDEGHALSLCLTPFRFVFMENSEFPDRDRKWQCRMTVRPLVYRGRGVATSSDLRRAPRAARYRHHSAPHHGTSSALSSLWAARTSVPPPREKGWPPPRPFGEGRAKASSVSQPRAMR